MNGASGENQPSPGDSTNLQMRREKNLFTGLGVAAIFLGAVLWQEKDMIAYLLLGFAIIIINLVETGSKIRKKKERAILLISGAIIVGSAVQLAASFTEPALWQAVFLLIILTGGLLIFIERMYRYSGLDRA